MHITFIDKNNKKRSIPAKYIVCPYCEGTGTHVNQSPDFIEEYQLPPYKVICSYCGGNRVVLVPNPDKCYTEEIKAYNASIKEEIPIRK